MEKKQPSNFAHFRDILLGPFTVTVVVPWLIYDGTHSFIPQSTFLLIPGMIMIFLGLIIFLKTIFLFHFVGGGTLAPWAPTQKLIINGPYKYSRNPMFLGIFIILLGESLTFHSSNIFLWMLGFMVIANGFVFLYEEPSLKKRFGEKYENYKENVPRWIPRRTPFQPDMDQVQ